MSPIDTDRSPASAELLRFILVNFSQPRSISTNAVP